jgi:hypothetical protein
LKAAIEKKQLPINYSVDCFADFFSVPNSHVPVTMFKLTKPRVLWINPLISKLDKNYQKFSNPFEYETFLLETCAFTTLDGLDSECKSKIDINSTTVGLADRYGGIGIGRNGGSGRNVKIGNYTVKGCGRTPLVGVDTDFGHASGGAYHEECVRETIYAEVVKQIFPFGAIPVLAIIDTGLNQSWPAPIHPSRERRVLLIRPLMLRPAHFERAVLFDAPREFEGVIDNARVISTFKTLNSKFTLEKINEKIKGYLEAWASQVSFAIANRLSHGNNTTSNICVNGALLDFGAMSSVPSWARFNVSKNPDSANEILGGIRAGIKSLSYFFWRHHFQSDELLNVERRLLATFNAKFENTFYFDCLLSIGLNIGEIDSLIKCGALSQVRDLIIAIFNNFQASTKELEISNFYIDAKTHSEVWTTSGSNPQMQLQGILARIFGDQSRLTWVRILEHRNNGLATLMKSGLRGEFFKTVQCEGVADISAKNQTGNFIERTLQSVGPFIESYR